MQNEEKEEDEKDEEEEEADKWRAYTKIVFVNHSVFCLIEILPRYESIGSRLDLSLTTTHIVESYLTRKK